MIMDVQCTTCNMPPLNSNAWAGISRITIDNRVNVVYGKPCFRILFIGISKE